MKKNNLILLIFLLIIFIIIWYNYYTINNYINKNINNSISKNEYNFLLTKLNKIEENYSLLLTKLDNNKNVLNKNIINSIDKNIISTDDNLPLAWIIKYINNSKIILWVNIKKNKKTVLEDKTIFINNNTKFFNINQSKIPKMINWKLQNIKDLEVDLNYLKKDDNIIIILDNNFKDKYIAKKINIFNKK